MRTAKDNIDRDELLRFDAQAAAWWERNGEFKGLHDINPIRTAYIQERANLRNKRVLDVGCGGGVLSEAMAALGARVTGVDAGEATLAVARRHAEQSGYAIDYRQGTAETLAEQEPGSFNVVACLELLEHVPDPCSVIAACGRLAKPGGDIFFATLNRTFKSFVLAIVAAEYILGVVKKGTHRWRNFIKPTELIRWAEASGLTHRDTKGIHYNPVFKRQGLRSDTSVNYLMHFQI
jgi:2-polyprenyl-6-hydroxyphenyl methylase/3-demethylubiquinone-9 3-methyltransferase